MAAPIGVDRKLAGEVRRLALNKIKAILERPAVEMSERDKELHDQILLKLAGTALPRLTEVTGEDGGALIISFDPAFKKNDPTPETSGDSGVVSQV